MTCSRALESIARLDRNEPPRGELANHLATCDRCHAAYERLTEIERSAAIEPSSPFSEPRVERIMMAVREASGPGVLPVEEPQRVRLPGWTAGGVVIIASLVGLQFSEVFAWLRSSIGSIVDVAVGTMLGLVITVYLLILVGSNLPEVRRILRLRIR